MRRFAILLLALALTSAACSGGDEEIARVGDASIRLSDIDDLFDSASLPIDDAFLETLFRLMAVEALGQALAAQFGVGPDPAAIDGYLAEFTATMEQEGLTPADFLGTPGASQEMVRFNARLLALRDQAIAQLVVAPATVDSLFSDPMTLTNVCVKHILVETREEAEAVLQRLRDGEDFAAVAGEVSLDTGTPDGDLGCAPAARYVYEFADAAVKAPLDELVGPVETEFGFHVLTVYQRTAPTRQEYLADPLAVLSDDDVNGIWTDWINDVLQTADAWVAERYGSWTPIGIKAPETEATTTSSAE